MRCVVTCLALLLVGCGASAPTTSRRVDSSGVDHAVVYLSTECTGILIGPRRVLTAGHCMEDPGPYRVRVDGAVGREEIAVDTCSVHPAAYGEPRGCGEGTAPTAGARDLAMLQLRVAVRGARPLRVALAPPSLSEAGFAGRSVRLVGWDRRPRLVGPLARRSGQNRVVQVLQAALVTEPVESGGFSTLIGDSGGPLLLEVGGEEQVVGVLFGGVSAGSSRSVYATTFDSENARWIVSAAGPEWGRDLASHNADERFGDRPLP